MPSLGAGAVGTTRGPEFFAAPEETPGEGPTVSAIGFADDPKKRAAISAAMEAGLARSFTAAAERGAGADAGAGIDAGMDLGAPLPRAIPCAASTFSTTRAIAARSTPTADAGGAAATGFFSSGFASAEIATMAGAGGALTFFWTASGAGAMAAPIMRWSAGTVRCSTPRDSQAIRFTFIKCCGPILSEVMFPPGAPQPSVIAGNRFVE